MTIWICGGNILRRLYKHLMILAWKIFPCRLSTAEKLSVKMINLLVFVKVKKFFRARCIPSGSALKTEELSRNRMVRR